MIADWMMVMTTNDPGEEQVTDGIRKAVLFVAGPTLAVNQALD